MKLGVFNPVLYDRNLEEAMQYLHALGVQAIELGCGGFPGTGHLDAKEVVDDAQAIHRIQECAKRYDLEISALSVHGNMVHPDAATAQHFYADYKAACRLAGKLGVRVVNTFSGCPGDCPQSRYPNWVTCPWPEDFLHILDYQWNDVLIPFWKEASAFALSEGVEHIALEMHPGFAVYNPETALRLRAAVGEVMGVNFDPSHLIWQGIDAVQAIRALRGAIYHVHAKDTKIDLPNSAVNGVLDTKPYAQESKRSWIFRTVGYGNAEGYWRDFFSALNLVGYTHVVSIEHEDSLMSPKEGLEKAVAFLKTVLIQDPKANTLWWA